MDRHKSGLKGAGLVMSGLKDNTNRPKMTLDETLGDLRSAQKMMVQLINKVIKNDIINYGDLERLIEINDALLSGINYSEHVRSTLDAIATL